MRKSKFVFVALLLSSATASATPVLRYQTDLHGSFVMFGNTEGQDCGSGVSPLLGTVGACGNNTSDTAPDIFWSADHNTVGNGNAWADKSITSAVARSTSVLNLPAGATVVYARLYWSAEYNGVGTTATLERRGVFSQLITADANSRLTESSTGYKFYQSSADITSIVQQYGVGDYRVGNFASVSPVNRSDQINYMGWSVAVVYQLATEPPRNITLFDGLDVVNAGGNVVNESISGFFVPNQAGFDAKLGLVAYEGDASITGDAFYFNGSVVSNTYNPEDNFFNSTHTNQEPNGLATLVQNANDLPRLTGDAGSLSGVDIDVIDVTSFVHPGDTNATLRAITSSDTYFFGVIAVAVSTFKPDFSNIRKSVVNLTEGNAYRPGDVLEYTVSLSNTGSDNGKNVVLTDPLPAGVTYVPGSLSIVAGVTTNVGSVTDAAGDDLGEVQNGNLTVRLGAGANATSGGVLTTADVPTVVKFRVTLNSGASGSINNQAFVSCQGDKAAQQGVGSVSYPSSNGSGPNTPTSFYVDSCGADGDCAGANPHCDMTQTPHVCTGCVDSSECSGATPVCKTATHVCVRCMASTDCTAPATCNGSGVCVLTAPVVTSPANNANVLSSVPTITGTAPADSTVFVKIDGSVVGSTVADAAGAWSFDINSTLAAGSHTVSATARTGAGSLATDSSASATITFKVQLTCTSNAACGGTTPVCDTTRKACVECTSNASCATGSTCTTSTGQCTLAPPVVTTPANNTVTRALRPAMGGTAPVAGSIISVVIDNVWVGNVTADAGSAWAYTPSADLSAGSHTVTAYASVTGSNTVTSVLSNAIAFSIVSGCLSAADCSGSTPACSNYTCVRCTANSDCQSGAVCATNTNSCYLAAPVIAAPASGSVSAVSPLQASGSAAANASVVVTLDGTALPAVTADASGHWSVSTSSSLAVGNHTLSATASVSDARGPITSSASASSSFTVMSGCLSTANCAYPTPECNVAANTCVQCLQDSSCSGATPVCGASFACVRCNSNLECPAGATCGSNNSCSLPTPTITGPAADALLNHGTVVLTGTAAPGSSVIVTFDNNPLPAVVVDASGVYSVTPNFTVGVGAHTFAVQATSGSTPLDVWSAVAGPRSFTMIDGCLDNTDCSGATPQCDTSAHTCVRCLGDNNCPGGATCAGQTCVLAAPVFVSPNANDLLSPQPTFTGTGPAGTTVTVTVDGNSVGQAVVDANGTWSVTPVAALPAMSHTATASASSGTGSLGVLSGNANSVVFDVACAGDQGSGSGADCANTNAPFCDPNHRCGMCHTASDCSAHAGSVCNSQTGSCGSTCGVDGDCTNAQFCSSSGSACSVKIPNGQPLPGSGGVGSIPCTVADANRLCASGVCDPNSNLCGLPNGATCDSGNLCQSGICTPNGMCGLPNGDACTSATQCRSNVCDPNGTCGVGDGGSCQSNTACLSNNCNAGQCAPCSGGACTTPCSLDADCSAAAYCGTAHTCVQDGNNGAACDRPSECRSGVCGPDGNCGSADGGACTTAAQCRGEGCNAGVCSATCSGDANCLTTEYCSAQACVPRQGNGTGCTSASQCLAHVCGPDGTCGAGTGDVCSSPSTCRSGVCSSSGVCSPTCQQDGDCLNTQFCNIGTGACTQDLPNGQSCDRAAECLTYACTDWLCGQGDGKPCTDNSACQSGLCSTATHQCVQPPPAGTTTGGTTTTSSGGTTGGVTGTTSSGGTTGGVTGTTSTGGDTAGVGTGPNAGSDTGNGTAGATTTNSGASTAGATTASVASGSNTPPVAQTQAQGRQAFGFSGGGLGGCAETGSSNGWLLALPALALLLRRRRAELR